MLPWFVIDCYYPASSDFYATESEEVDEEMVKAYTKGEKRIDNYLIGETRINLGEDPIKRLDPGFYVKGKHKIHYTILIFCSGDAVAVPFAREEVFSKLDQYYKSFTPAN